MKLPDEIRRAVEDAPLAHLTTLNRDGSPQVTVVWIGLEGDELVCGHMGAWRKVKNVRRDPRVAVSFLAKGRNAMGLPHYAVVYGSAYVTEGGAAELLQRLARRYMSPDVVFPPEPLRSRPGYVTHIRPERLAGIGPWSPGRR